MKYYLGHSHYKINCLHYMTINKSYNNKTCISRRANISNNNQLKDLITYELAKDFKSLGSGWFWCITHENFISVLEGAGAICKWKKLRKNYDFQIQNVYKHWRCSECDECSHISTCCIHVKRAPSGKIHPEYFCVFSFSPPDQIK